MEVKQLYDYAILLKKQDFPLLFVADLGLNNHLSELEELYLQSLAVEVLHQRRLDESVNLYPTPKICGTGPAGS